MEVCGKTTLPTGAHFKITFGTSLNEISQHNTFKIHVKHIMHMTAITSDVTLHSETFGKLDGEEQQKHDVLHQTAATVPNCHFREKEK